MIEAAVHPAPAVPPSGRETARDPRDDRVTPHTRGHWAAPDVAGDIVAVAREPGSAEPVEIRVRPELHQLLQDEVGPVTDVDGIPLVVDEDIPAFPGYEIHRAFPGRRDAGPRLHPAEVSRAA